MAHSAALLAFKYLHFTSCPRLCQRQAWLFPTTKSWLRSGAFDGHFNLSVLHPFRFISSSAQQNRSWRESQNQRTVYTSRCFPSEIKLCLRYTNLNLESFAWEGSEIKDVFISIQGSCFLSSKHQPSILKHCTKHNGIGRTDTGEKRSHGQRSELNGTKNYLPYTKYMNKLQKTSLPFLARLVEQNLLLKYI